MSDRSDPSLRDCLAYAVLDDYETWLGTPSPSCLSVFLSGAVTRASLLGHVLPAWRVYGPLELPEFYMPLVARTGHPLLSIKWATAVELHHFSLTAAMRELGQMMQSWVAVHGLETKDEVKYEFCEQMGLDGLLGELARRPGMFLGDTSGWSLYCYLAGMDKGGDWLGLPVLPRLREIVDGIEERSEESYGSRFAAYRVYDGLPAELLAWVGIEPEGGCAWKASLVGYP
jgi:hypothetical protein